ncbi:hypothetical protein PVAP13_3KG091400 [Panicum virgatum]|uniref:Uncharacterized protein n=1 Tax=Panicum virgatum TaxID=38727 RepID=A0A8T0US05_PANVG|nr:hypothetical protein PVAP13_3KG091400 [Panicum virgatum]
MASPQMTMVMVFLVLLLASSSPCLSQARLMILSDHYAQPNRIKSSSISTSPAATSTTTTTTSAQQLAQGVALPSPPVAPATGGIDHPESNGGWIPEGSVPSPGVGHHP